MPNWEWANYEISDKETNISLLNREFEAAKQESTTSDFGEQWLGNLLVHIGYTYDDVCKGINAPNCRGSILDKWSSGTLLYLETESAWVPMDECVIQFVRHFCPDAVIHRTQMIEYTEEL